MRLLARPAEQERPTLHLGPSSHRALPTTAGPSSTSRPGGGEGYLANGVPHPGAAVDLPPQVRVNDALLPVGRNPHHFDGRVDNHAFGCALGIRLHNRDRSRHDVAIGDLAHGDIRDATQPLALGPVGVEVGVEVEPRARGD